jgi:plasmid stabilization system protein ParE
MATVEITRKALADLERLFDFIAAENPQKAREQILSVRKAFELLADHPLLGRPAEKGRRVNLHRSLTSNRRRRLIRGSPLFS